ncbi:MAG: BamA/OMP85 family outer membrane protein [Candidatus Geothermincolia bacterium]
MSALLAAAVLWGAPVAQAATAVRIEGNAAIGTRRLREAAAAELAGLEEPARRAAAAEDAAFQMVSAGRRAGYAFIEVDFAITGEGDDTAVVFKIREGPLVRLGEVSFSGNAFFTAAQLVPHIALERPTPYVESDVGAGRNEIVQLYRAQGFADVKIGEPQLTLRSDRSVADVRFEIAEGTRFVIARVVFEGDELPHPGQVLKGLESSLIGEPYFGRRKLALGNDVTGAFGAQGYPEAAVTVREEPGTLPGGVVLRVSVASGPRVRISRVEVSGNERTRAGFILSRIPVRRGDWFNEKALQGAFRDLYRTGVFSRVGHSLVGEGAERVLRIEVEEAPSREAAVEAGWGAYEQLRGRVSFRDRNVFGTMRSAGAEAGASLKSRFVKADVLDPRILGSDFSLSIPLSWRFREEPTFTKEEVELALRLYRLFPGKVTAGLKYGYRFEDLSSLSPDVPADARDERYTSASLKANLDIDRRDDFFYPSRGWQTGLSVEVADRRLGGTLDFLRCTGGAKFFQSLGAGVVLGLRLDTGFVAPMRGNENLPVSERFFTGGDGSVRSFEEQQLGPQGATGDPLGGLASTVLGIEVRRRIVGNLAASVFADFGNVAPNRSLEGLDPAATTTAELSDAMWRDYLKDFRAGVGVGLQYLTPLGPVRLDLAANPAPREGEAAFAWHFSVGMAF